MLNEGLTCKAIIPRGLLPISQDGRSASIQWKCGMCLKAPKASLETMFAVSRRACDWCLAENLIDVSLDGLE